MTDDEILDQLDWINKNPVEYWGHSGERHYGGMFAKLAQEILTTRKLLRKVNDAEDASDYCLEVMAYVKENLHSGD